MTKNDPAFLSQSTSSNQMNDRASHSDLTAIDEQIVVSDGGPPQSSDTNRMWTILSLSLTIIIGFWIGFLINEYFYQVPISEPNSSNSFNELEAFDQERAVVNGDPYIIFQEQNYGTGETISFPSGNECLKNLNLVIEDIQEDMITFQIEEFASTVHEDPDEAGDGFIWGDFKDPSCFSIRSSCEDTLFEYCFYMTHADGLHYLNYDLGEQRSSESLIRTLEL